MALHLFQTDRGRDDTSRFKSLLRISTKWVITLQSLPTLFTYLRVMMYDGGGKFRVGFEKYGKSQV
jgi:hypothetical protein